MNSGGHWGNRTRISPALGESRADNEGDVTEGVHGRRHYGTEVFELSPSVLGWAESVLGLADPPLRGRLACNHFTNTSLRLHAL